MEGKTIHELREIARVLGIVPSTMKKQELIDTIVSKATRGDSAPAEEEPARAKRGRRPRMNSVRVENNASQAATTPSAEPQMDSTNEPVAEADTESVAVEHKAATPTEHQPKRRGRKPKVREVVEKEAIVDIESAEDDNIVETYIPV